MKSLIISYSDWEGGAARAAYRLHKALPEADVESEMWVRRSITGDPAVHLAPGGWGPRNGRWRRHVDSWALRGQSVDRTVPRSANLLPTRWAPRVVESGSDVVNLHWIGSGMMSIEDVGRIPLPIVWTLHDMWAFTGSEHYAPDGPDARWRTGYRRANRDVGDGRLDLDRYTWMRKSRSLRASHVVAPSSWLARCAEDSALMSGWPVHVIPNPVDVSVFSPVEARAAREALGLPLDARIVGFGSLDALDPRKGLDLLLDALGRLTSDGVVAVVFGAGEPSGTSRLDVPVHWVGPVVDDRRLAALYSAADVIVVPSRQENLPQTATEALACGTPVVAFDTSGLGDAVEHRGTGYLAEPFSTEDLAAGIDWVLAEPDRATALGREGRRVAIERWAPAVVANRYREVFEEAIADADTHR